MLAFIRLLAVIFRSRASLAAENLALRHQLGVLQRSVSRPRLRQHDRIFWAWLSRLWPGWRSCLVIVQPETVVRWHRQGFKLYWRWKSRRQKPGRPPIDAEIQKLIRQMSLENALWGSPRIRDELALLGFDLAKATVERYMAKPDKPRSQNWRTFIDNHISELTAVDFFTIPTVTFRVLYCFLVLRLDRRVVVHFNVTTNPTSRWTAQQLVEAFPYDEAPRSRRVLRVLPQIANSSVARGQLAGAACDRATRTRTGRWHASARRSAPSVSTRGLSIGRPTSTKLDGT